jgi:hypothetical protein
MTGISLPSRRLFTHLRADVLEARVAPATLQVLSETVTGDLSASEPDGSWSGSDTLTDYSINFLEDPNPTGDSAMQQARKSLLPKGGDNEFEIYSAVGFVGLVGTSTSQVDLTFKINPGPGDPANGSIAVSYQGGCGIDPPSTLTGNFSATLTGPGVDFVGGPTEDGGSFSATFGQTYTIHVLASFTCTDQDMQDPVNDQPSGGANIDVDVPADAAGALKVKAAHDSEGAPDDAVFGDYLTGVKLDNQFKVTGDSQAKSYRFSIDGVTDSKQTKPVNKNGTVFTYDMGKLAAEPDGSEKVYNLKIEALDAKGNVVDTLSPEPTIKVEGQFGLSLSVSATNDSAPPQPIADARLIAGVPVEPTLNFQPAVTSTFSYPTFYQGDLALTFFKHGTTDAKTQYTLMSVVDGVGTLQGPVKGSDFADLISDPTQYDFDITVTPAKNHQDGKTAFQFDQPEHLRVVSLPNWIKKNAAPGRKTQFVADAATAGQFGAGAAAYELPIQFAHAYDLPLPKTSGTPFGLLDRLKSGATLDAGLTVYAPLFDDESPTFIADHLVTDVTYLGDTVYKAALDPTKFKITGTLEPTTLAAPNSVNLATAQPFSLIPSGGLTIHRDFGPWEISVPVFTAGFANLNGTVTIEGAFDAAVSQLDLGGSITFNLADGKVVPSETTGNLALDITAAATATLGAGVAVSVDVLGYKVVDLFKADGSGSVTFDLDAHVAANFGGKTGLTIDSANTTATADVTYDFNYDISFLTKDPKDPTNIKEATDEKSGSIWKL